MPSPVVKGAAEILLDRLIRLAQKPKIKLDLVIAGLLQNERLLLLKKA